MAKRSSTEELDKSFEILVIGASLGGLKAFEIILSALPGDFQLPIAIVQHRDKDPDNKLTEVMQSFTALAVKEVEDKEPILPGRVYLAPPDYHLLIDQGFFGLSTEAPVSYARPSIDVLFETASDAYAEKVIGVVLAGANKDGARGAARIKERGGIVLVQDPDTAEIGVMPRAAIEATKVDGIMLLPEIAPFLINLTRNIRR